MSRFAFAAAFLVALIKGASAVCNVKVGENNALGHDDCGGEAPVPQGNLFNMAASPLRLAGLGEGETIWGDHKGTVSTSWADVPAWMNGFQVNFGKKIKLEPTTVTYQCPLESTSGHKQCELFVFQYRCETCGFVDGDLPMYISSLNEGWSSFLCTPKFRIVFDGHKHPMIGFRKVVDAGVVYELELPNAVEFAAFAMNTQYDGDCEDNLAQADCEATQGRCAWEGGACLFKDCKRVKSYGPGKEQPECSNYCVAEDYPLTPIPYTP